ncbi:MAG: tetraprenyl-beta-curcumene synthase family protein [Veillonellales bacterium]
MFPSLADTACSVHLLHQFIGSVFPVVNQELAYWRQYATQHSGPALREQALASIRDKKFHCQGGSVYSLYPGVAMPDFVRLVVALQTISDYLDNLCDRAGITDEQAFRQLHLAMTCALDPAAPLPDFYRYYPFKDDGGYLEALVETCRQQTSRLPAYELVKPEVLRLAKLYSELQTYKHIDKSLREGKMAQWIHRHSSAYPGITDWEFAAATGSTLGMFTLCAAAGSPALTATEVTRISSAYFPWISGFHILLDYFIDTVEDEKNGDLNFVSYYESEQQKLSRLTYFGQQALRQAASLSHPSFTRTVVQGLFAMYLSDPKTELPSQQNIKQALLHTGGVYTRLIYTLCRLLRCKQNLQ